MRNHLIAMGALALGASALPQSRKSDHPISAPARAPHFASPPGEARNGADRPLAPLLPLQPPFLPHVAFPEGFGPLPAWPPFVAPPHQVSQPSHGGEYRGHQSLTKTVTVSNTSPDPPKTTVTVVTTKTQPKTSIDPFSKTLSTLTSTVTHYVGDKDRDHGHQESSKQDSHQYPPWQSSEAPAYEASPRPQAPKGPSAPEHGVGKRSEAKFWPTKFPDRWGTVGPHWTPHHGPVVPHHGPHHIPGHVNQTRPHVSHRPSSNLTRTKISTIPGTSTVYLTLSTSTTASTTTTSTSNAKGQLSPRSHHDISTVLEVVTQTIGQSTVTVAPVTATPILTPSTTTQTLVSVSTSTSVLVSVSTATEATTLVSVSTAIEATTLVSVSTAIEATTLVSVSTAIKPTTLVSVSTAIKPTTVIMPVTSPVTQTVIVSLTTPSTTTQNPWLQNIHTELVPQSFGEDGQLREDPNPVHDLNPIDMSQFDEDGDFIGKDGKGDDKK